MNHSNALKHDGPYLPQGCMDRSVCLFSPYVNKWPRIFLISGFTPIFNVMEKDMVKWQVGLRENIWLAYFPKLVALICAATVWWLCRASLPYSAAARGTASHHRLRSRASIGETAPWWRGSFFRVQPTKPIRRFVARSTDEMFWWIAGRRDRWACRRCPSRYHFFDIKWSLRC